MLKQTEPRGEGNRGYREECRLLAIFANAVFKNAPNHAPIRPALGNSVPYPRVKVLFAIHSHRLVSRGHYGCCSSLLYQRLRRKVPLIFGVRMVTIFIGV